MIGRVGDAGGRNVTLYVSQLLFSHLRRPLVFGRRRRSSICLP